MLVGSKDINLDDLKVASSSDRQLEEYAISLVPKCIRHMEKVIDNQKYLLALYLRDMSSISYTIRKQRCENLIKGISITGVINTVIDFEDVLLEVDMDLLVMYLFEME